MTARYPAEIFEARRTLMERGVEPLMIELRPDFDSQTAFSRWALAPLSRWVFGLKVMIGETNRVGGRRKHGKYEIVPTEWVEI